MAAKNSGPDAAIKPVLMKGRKKIEINISDLIDILTMIRDFDNQPVLADLATKKNLTVSVGAKSVNAVKRLVADHEGMRSHPIGKKILFPAPRRAAAGENLIKAASDPYSSCCHFSDRG